MKNKTKLSQNKIAAKFSWRSMLIILLLFIFFPVGVPVMWKFAKWSKRTKCTVTGVVAVLVVIGMVSAYYSEPEITVADNKYGKMSTDDRTHVLNGYLRSMRGKVTLTINNHPITLSDTLEFSHQVSLVEGENLISLKAANENGSSEEVISVHRTTSAELAQRAAKLNAEEAAKAKPETVKKLDVTEEKTATLKTDSSCNWWCKLTGGNKTESQKNATQQDSANQAAEPTKPYKQFSSYIPRGSSSANIQNWAYTGGENPSEDRVKTYMKDIFDKQCGEGTSWGKCDILLWDKEYNVNTSVYNDTCIDEGGYRTQLIGYIKGTSGSGQFFYKCVSGNVTLSEDSQGVVVTNSVDGKAKYTTSFYIDSGYVNEPAY